jgi:alpha-beta hydrolase superfamily lysophospholipase
MFQLEAAMELAKLALSGKTLLAGVIGSGAKATSEATGSIGRFLTELGPIAGPIAYGAMIGGVIAQIATARKKAEQQIKALSGPLAGVSSGGGGSAPIAPPAFNVVGATQTSQLAQTISQAEQQPLRAYVVASDISTAQELERSTIEGASIG